MRGDVAIRVEGLTKRFGELTALDGIGFEVPQATVFGLLGPNGAGKTTAVRILATVLQPDGGTAEILGHDVVHDPVGVRYLIGLAGQSAAVDPNLTGRENLRLIGRFSQLTRAEAEGRAGELLDRFELSEAADRPVRTYSGGMRRRLDVAAALVAEPPILFLDEPTTGLDLSSRNELWQMIRELVAGGTTVLLTTQYLEEADRLADRIAVVDHGHVVANDTPANLKAGLGSTVVEMGLGDEQAATRAQGLVSSGAFGEHVEREGATLRLTSNDGSRVLVGLLRTLDAEGLAPATLTVRDPSIDDVFLQLTGHRAESQEPSAASANGGRGRRGRR
ncbi:MAG TPA: ATP-binding cassette domain-containing protein [Actinomycetota bacterium]|nr:ATP-binding cassette domain-containing protein [Actinomycetota bacterium]